MTAALPLLIALLQPVYAGDDHLRDPAPDGVRPDLTLAHHAVTTTPSGLRIHAIRTGFVRVKAPHREWAGPAALALPAILGSKSWAPWMPMITYVIEHPDGTIMVDAGMDPGINATCYFDGQPTQGWFYNRHLRFFVGDDDGLSDRLEMVDLDPYAVTDVVVTHFHGDHIGGFSALPLATARVGSADWADHDGAFTARLPGGFQPQVVAWEDTTAGVFERSLALTADGRVRIVPLPGHSDGHIGVLVQDGDQSWLMAGDATFDLDQTQRGAVGGISEDMGQARATQAQVLEQVQAHGTVLLPAHDPGAFERLSPRVQ